MSLDGWTKVGDRIEGTGRWVVYRHRAVLRADYEVLSAFEDEGKATKFFTKKASDIRRGGIWLVSPIGRVCGATFIRS
jgi:hypothetical protein